MIGLDVLRNNIQMLGLMILWLLAGIYTGPGVYLFIPATLFLIFSNDRMAELVLGFIFILVLSDSLEEPLMFAKSFKNLYILLIFFFFILSLKKLQTVSVTYQYFVPYFIFGAIGLMYSPIFFTSFQKLLSYILLFIAVPNLIIIAYQASGNLFFRNLLYFLLFIVVVGFLLRFYNPEVAYSHGGRLRGIFGNPNGLGIFMILFFILFAVINVKFPELFSRYEIIIFYLIMFYVLYKTGSRTSLIAVVIFFFFSWVFKYSAFFGFLLFFIIMVSMEFLIIYFPRLIVYFGMEKVFRVETLEEGSGRLIAWEFAWQNIQDSFFIGRGLGFDESIMRDKENREVLAKAGHEGGVHNTYLIMWLNTGLLGLLAFLRGLFTVFIFAAKKNTMAFPVLFAVLFSINFEPWLAASLNPYTILFLIVITLLTQEIFNNENLEDNDQEVEENS